MRNLSDSHSSRGSLTTKLLNQMPLVLPPLDIIDAFDNVASPRVSLLFDVSKSSIFDHLCRRETKAVNLVPELLPATGGQYKGAQAQYDAGSVLLPSHARGA